MAEDRKGKKDIIVPKDIKHNVADLTKEEKPVEEPKEVITREDIHRSIARCIFAGFIREDYGVQWELKSRKKQ